VIEMCVFVGLKSRQTKLTFEKNLSKQTHPSLVHNLRDVSW